MKKSLFLLVMMITLSLSFANAQKTNLIFFSESGEQFYVILNAVLQNEKPETNVKVTDLIAPSYKLKILFKDSTIAPLEKNLMFNKGTETTFNIKKNNKGEYVVRYFNEIPIAQAAPPATGQSVVVFSASGPSEPVIVSSVSTTHTTSTNVNNNNYSEGISGGVNVGGVNMGMNINTHETGAEGTSSTTTYSTTTTTTTTTSSAGTGIQTNPKQPQQQEYIMPGYSGPVGCHHPISPDDFASVKNTISSKSFEDSKLTIAKQVIASNCLLSSQVREIMMLFSFEDSKIEFAKYAYSYTFDIGNYFKVNDAFIFESSIDELNTYISGLKK